ncbi:MAG: putative toxin-antitoxin system toxin component, PIN family, partial [Phototrophicales bacterium]
MIDVVLDTNVIISGMLWAGTPKTILQMAQQHLIQTISSEPLIEELKDVIARDKFQKFLNQLQKTPDDVVNSYLNYTRVIEPVELSQNVVRDMKDDKVITCAIGGKADYLITGDNDLLILKTYQGIRIVT